MTRELVSNSCNITLVALDWGTHVLQTAVTLWTVRSLRFDLLGPTCEHLGLLKTETLVSTVLLDRCQWSPFESVTTDGSCVSSLGLSVWVSHKGN